MARAGDAVSECRTWRSEGDDALAGALARRGYTHDGKALQVNRRKLDALPEQFPLPQGWSRAAVDTDQRIDSRVECHRAAFAPSLLTAEKYHRVRRTWPYCAELDRVVLDDRGAVVAACTAWLDETNGEGLFEPVATRPAEQRRGFGRAVCIDALHALRAAGARSAQVLCEADSAACATYAAVGFEPRGRLLSYSRAL
jgi:predicted N-acetyltransferase YhbS